MLVKTILNRGAVRFVEGRGKLALEVEVYPRPNRRPVCSGCGRSGPGYDRLAALRGVTARGPRRLEAFHQFGPEEELDPGLLGELGEDASERMRGDGVALRLATSSTRADLLRGVQDRGRYAVPE